MSHLCSVCVFDLCFLGLLCLGIEHCLCLDLASCLMCQTHLSAAAIDFGCHFAKAQTGRGSGQPKSMHGCSGHVFYVYGEEV